MAEIIALKRRCWLLGMHWVSSDQPLSALDLQLEASQLEAQWMAKRATTDTRQTGFAPVVSSAGNPWRLYSLAATLAGAFRPPWCGVFNLGDGLWWYLAVGEGHAVLPDGDVVGTHEAIEAVRQSHRTLAQWELHEGDRDTLALLMANLPPVRVRSLAGWPVSSWRWAGLGVAVILLLAVATWWFQYQKTLRQFHQQQQYQQRQRQASGHEKEFSQLPMPESWALNCQKTLESIPLSRYGWQVGVVTCQGPSVEVNWDWKEGALLTKRPEGVVSVSGDHVTQNLFLERALAPGVDNRVEVGRAVEALQDWAQVAGLDLNLENQPGSQEPVIHFRLQSPVMPFGFNFDSLPGLRLQRMSSNAQGWDIQGAVYGKP